MPKKLVAMNFNHAIKYLDMLERQIVKKYPKGSKEYDVVIKLIEEFLDIVEEPDTENIENTDADVLADCIKQGEPLSTKACEKILEIKSLVSELMRAP